LGVQGRCGRHPAIMPVAAGYAHVRKVGIVVSRLVGELWACIF
jgi:hypothetical protein